MSEQTRRESSGSAASPEAAARAVSTVRPSASRFQPAEPANATLIRLTEILGRIAERVERRATQESEPVRPAA